MSRAAYQSKHGFPERPRPGQKVIVGYEADGENWKLSISDNGDGMPDRKGGTEKTGLGTTLIKALAQQLEAQVDIVSGPKGTTVSITHGTPDRAWSPLTGAGRRWLPKSNGGSVAAT